MLRVEISYGGDQFFVWEYNKKGKFEIEAVFYSERAALIYRKKEIKRRKEQHNG